ncbi:MAG TPA: DNA replication/repair protein RecF [Gammaproteobacteria bacterium]
MSLRRLQVKAVRCLQEIEADLHPHRNYVFGPNGAGKTSLLESVYLLGRGRSFRTRDTRRLIRHGESRLFVYGEVGFDDERHRLGVAFERGKLDKRLDGAPAESMATLASILPAYVIDPSSHGLVEGGPSERRRFLDWGVFHVEQSYLAAWRRYRRLLSQRNAALKARTGGAELEAWTAPLAEAGAEVDALRRGYVTRLAPWVEAHGQRLLQVPLRIEYRPGWPEGQTLAQALAASRARDLQTGVTEVGPHRADLLVRLGEGAARDEASRGQQKLAACALILAQVALHAASLGPERAVLLVDDPAAELDRNSLDRLVQLLAEAPAQQLLTGLPGSALTPVSEAAVFHVEQGGLRRMV